MLNKQDQIPDKQGKTPDMKSYIDQRFERIEADLKEVKKALKEKGII